MYENSFGVPEMLPAGYGGEQGSPSSVRMNALPSAVPAHLVQQNQQNQQQRPSMRAVPNSPPPGFRQMQHVPAVLKLSDVENEFDDPYENVYEYGAAQLDDSFDYEYEFYGGYGGFGAASSGPPIKEDPKLKIKYRVLDTRKKDGYMYRQYENGSYAITAGKVPSGVKLNVPFTAKENKAAFAAVKKLFEAAHGPFPAGAKLSKASKKKAKKKGKKVDVGKLAQTGLEVAGKVAKKFEESGQAAAAVDETPSEAPADAASAASDADLPWYAKRVMGIPVWGLVAGAVVVSGGLYLAFRTPSVPTAAAPPVAPPPPTRRAIPATTEAPAAQSAEEVGEE